MQQVVSDKKQFEKAILPAIVFAQFFCTSVWFAGNAVIFELVKEQELDRFFLAHLTSAIQLGFITGTLFFAVFSIADRFSPSRVFFASALCAACCNLGISIQELPETGILVSRLLTGFFLAGIYPVGMKIASDHYKEGLGKSLGFLVGALVIGTALPHLLKQFLFLINWRYVVYGTSILSIAGGIIIQLCVPDGQYRKAGQKIKLTSFLKGFENRNFRIAALGYFGHMWELYTFWAFVPVIITTYNHLHPTVNLPVAILSFLVIASGGLACVISGSLANKFGAKNLATISLVISCACCLLSPILLVTANSVLAIGFLFLWGMTVISDSPLFSTLIATHAPATSKGASLTIVNCIGFSITILSLQAINFAATIVPSQYLYMLLAIGPLIGIIALLNRTGNRQQESEMI
ncbi:MAG: MFS transporter [Bacteroidota bacterium]